MTSRCDTFSVHTVSDLCEQPLHIPIHLSADALCQDSLVNATRAPITISGLKVYSAFFEPGMGYRIDNTTGIAKGNEEETLYMVTSGKHFNDGCCFE